MTARKPPELVTKDQVVQAERTAAYEVLYAYDPDYRDTGWALAMEKFIRHIHSAIELESMDARLIEGDDEAEIRGY